MGNILQGLCRCGFDTGDIFAGGGFVNFMDTCNAPALCPNCNEFLIKNYMKNGSNRCPACHSRVTFYDDPSLHDPSPGDDQYDFVFVWRINGRDDFFKLPDAKFLCPKCNNMSLVFEDKGCWD